MDAVEILSAVLFVLAIGMFVGGLVLAFRYRKIASAERKVYRLPWGIGADRKRKAAIRESLDQDTDPDDLPELRQAALALRSQRGLMLALGAQVPWQTPRVILDPEPFGTWLLIVMSTLFVVFSFFIERDVRLGATFLRRFPAPASGKLGRSADPT